MTKPKTDRVKYTLEFKLEAVRLVDTGLTLAAAARSLGISDQTLFNWVKAHRQGRLTGADIKSVTPEQMEIASFDFRHVLQGYGIVSSMSRRGNCWDNACSETVFGSLKVERLHGLKFKTRRAAKDEVINWLLWYNQERLHSTLHYVSPMQYEQNWQRQQP
ncbi:IS3 family transposase [Pseudomonas syringae]|uniref:IS3 family transposase n=1 Tax=Pseudomonas syringae TaxID=317 RepID=UPI000624D96D|nr:Transposase [Pseudomonas syringae pv. syringae B301D]